MQADLFEHSASNGHNGFLEDCIITLIDKTDDVDPTRREKYWRRLMKTAPPYGLNTVAQIPYQIPYSCLVLAYIFPRQGFYYRKIFNLVNTIISTEEPSGESSYGDQPIDLLCKTFGWFPYGVGFCWKVLSCRVYSHCFKCLIIVSNGYSCFK